MEKVFAFDVGTGSLGIAVRRDMEIAKADSLLLPEDAGSLEELRTARRQYRTRLAHAAREAYWRRICEEAGIEVLHSRIPGIPKLNIPPQPGDPRLEREFAADDDETLYTSCLLRIKLLRGEKLEGWQVFKAVRSAMQRRGFDREVPWKNRASARKGAEEESKTAASATEYETMLREYSGGNPDYLYPCYFDAFRMGLWDPKTNEIRRRPETYSERARGFTPPRELVIAELRKLLENAAKLFPKLAGRTDEVLFGPGREQYASYYAEKRKQFQLKEGGAGDWNALVGQKIPRFDNRLPGKCALIPRLHVCMADDVAAVEAVFLLKVKNLRAISPEGREVSLSAETIRTMLEAIRTKAQKKREELKTAGETKAAIRTAAASQYKITKTDLKKCLKRLGLESLPGSEEVEAPHLSGRSGFSRPAAKIMRELILSGESPRVLYEKLMQKPPEDLAGGDLAEDLRFLQVMPDSWDQIHVPDMGFAKNSARHMSEDEAVARVIAEQRSPLIRLRLKIFDRELRKLMEDPAIGKPDRIVIEFVRTDFLSKEEKKKLELRQKERQRDNTAIREFAASQGMTSETDLLKLKLLKEQGNICPYTGDTLSPNQLDLLEIDHMVPRHGGRHGSDSYVNKVVTKRSTNGEKGARTPYEFLHGSGKWTAYRERVIKMKLSLRKQKLLLSPEAEKLDERYSDLCSTAWIARIFRDIAALRCHWADGAAGEERHIVVVNGAITAALRRKYRIDSLLAPDCTDAASIEKKNREDKRHHALDAMVLTFATFWMRNPALREELAFPEGIDRRFFQRYLEDVNPRNILLPVSKLEETFFGKRVIDGETIMTKRESLISLGLKSNKFDGKTARKGLAQICDKRLKDFLLAELEKTEIADTTAWNEWCSRIVSPDTGKPVRKVRIFKGTPEEYKDLSKDGGEFRGQYRRGDQHRGQFIYLDAKGKARVRPVYAHGSVYQERRKLRAEGFVVVGFFQSGCSVLLKEHAVSGKNHAAPGEYILKSLWANGQFVLFKNGTDILLSLSAIPDIVNNMKRL